MSTVLIPNPPLSPTSNDVIGGGPPSDHHPGNQQWKIRIAATSEVYEASDAQARNNIARWLIHEVEQRQPPGRFLAWNRKADCWYELTADEAMDKTRQAFIALCLEKDIVVGKRRGYYNYPGSKQWRTRIQQLFKEYEVASKQGKKDIECRLIHEVGESNPPGRFLKWDKGFNVWYEMTSEEVLKKTKQDFINFRHKTLL